MPSNQYYYEIKFTKAIIRIDEAIKKLGKCKIKDHQKKEVFAHIQRRFDAMFREYLYKTEHKLSNYLSLRNNAIELQEQCLPLLKQHQESKKIINNIVLAILGLGVIYGLAISINYLCNKRVLFFQNETANQVKEAANQVDVIFNAIDGLQNNPIAAKIN